LKEGLRAGGGLVASAEQWTELLERDGGAGAVGVCDDDQPGASVVGRGASGEVLSTAGSVCAG